MPTAIIIGFEYTFSPLPGTLIDIYHAVHWARTFNCTTYVLTDIAQNIDYDIIKKSISLGIADEDLITFYNSIPKLFIDNSRSLLEEVIKILRTVTDDQLVIYYSGHGVKDCLVMPNKDLLALIDMRDNILSHLSVDTEIFWILDCCNPNGLHLPFKLEQNQFVLSSSKIECVLQPILLIVSSDAQEKSITTEAGSLFTRHLFRLLTTMNSAETITDRNRNLRRLLGNLSSAIRRMHTGYTQTVSVYSSYVIDPILWLWIGSQTSNIAIDVTLSTIVVR